MKTYYTQNTIFLTIRAETQKKAKEIVKEKLKDFKETHIEIMTEPRTNQQNKALHLYFTLLAEALNAAGFDMKKTIKIDIPWTAMTVKEYLWRPVMNTYLQKKSTTKLNKQVDIDEVWEIINREIGQRTGVFVEFPSRIPEEFI